MKTITLYLPGSTDVVLKGFTNAAYLQRITMTLSPDTPVGTWTGSGEGNNPMFTSHLTTPAGDDVELNISFDSSSDGGHTWNAEDIYSEACSVQNYRVNVVVSEDLADADYNDCVCCVSYSESLPSRLSRAERSPAATAVHTPPVEADPPPPGNSVTVLLPYSTAVVIQAFANAANTQQVTIQHPGDTATVWTGTGYYDTPLGSMMIQTPPGTGKGFPVTVTIQNSSDGGTTWQASQVAQGACQPMYYVATIVASEDGTDTSWDDATVYLTWTALSA